MAGAGGGVEVACLEGLEGHLAVDVEDTVAFVGAGIGHLVGEDGFSGVGGCEEGCDFAFDEDTMVEVGDVGEGFGVVHPAVEGLDVEGSEALGQALDAAAFGADGGDGVVLFHGGLRLWRWGAFVRRA